MKTTTTDNSSRQLPRGLRNKNPLNIIYNANAPLWQGQRGHDGKFCIFHTLEDGYRAAFRVLDTYNKRHHIYSVQEIIYRWAPPKDRNNTPDYVRRMCKEAHLSETTPVVMDSWSAEMRERAMRLVWAMAKVELGDSYVTEADMETVRRGYYRAFPQYEGKAE